MFCRKRSVVVLWFVVVLAVSMMGVAQAQEKVSLEKLLDEMTSMERLASWSGPAYTTGQFSSYDRRSIDPEILTEEHWFANGDRGNVLRKETVGDTTEYVLMDAEGPGAIVRFWSANPYDAGTIKIYLDHEEEPAIEMTLTDFLGGEAAPFIAPLGGERGKGWNNYFPLPYAKHCKVSATERDFYYIINYRSYDADVAVTTFSLEETASLRDKIEETAKALEKPESIKTSADTEGFDYEVVLSPGASERLSLYGPAAIAAIQCKFDAEEMERGLRGTRLTVQFDEEGVCVDAPLGDFFGAAPGLNPYESLPCGVLPDGTMYAHWLMPFQQGAVFTIENCSDMEVKLEGTIAVEARPWTDDSLYFHGKWKCEQNIPTRPRQDWNYFSATGTGRFCGVMLHIANPVPQWWGEGDEKIYVDGESFPGFFGTGTEDYFGYAWSDTARFTHAYHNQPRSDGPGNAGHSCVSRFHVMDDIPFKKDIKFDMELWHWADTEVTQAVMVYWYSRPGGSDNFPAIDRALLGVPEIPEPEGVAGALEGEKMQVLAQGVGTVSTQGGWPWSRGLQVWWCHAEVGDTLDLEFPVDEPGEYEVVAVFTKAPDYGIHELSLNGRSVGAPIDFYDTEVTITEEQSLGRFSLKRRGNRLHVTLVGANAEALPGHMFGLDYLRLIP
ncbi:MAG: DUF2961 domain-containing protein [Candidatus Hydrogenedentes bacterium]|nr:DUF2961 domain-containing protein [Candidatus Hydrogenedentota bacterium]